MGILSAQDLFIIVLSLAVVCYLTPVSRVAQVLARQLASACGALWKALLSGNTPLEHDRGYDAIATLIDVVQGVYFGYILVYWACSFAVMLAFVSHLVLCPCVL